MINLIFLEGDPMNTLQAIIRLYEIKETMEEKKLKQDYTEILQNEFQKIKTFLLHSNFAFDNVKNLIVEVEKKMNLN